MARSWGVARFYGMGSIERCHGFLTSDEIGENECEKKRSRLLRS